MTGSVGPPKPAASMMMTAPTTGDPKSDEMAAKLAGRGHQAEDLLGRILLGESDGQDAEARS